MKRDNKGFTLVELLAVIVIMGILMMVAIPSVTRTIENSRKDTFVNIAKSYGNSARELWTSEGLVCQTPEGVYSPSGVPDGKYYIKISTETVDNAPVLLDQGGKSSWGNRHMKGYVEIDVNTQSGYIGDGNNDGIIGAADLTFCSKVVAEIIDVSSFEKKMCDINADQSVNSDDITLLARAVGGVDDGHPNIGNLITEKNVKFYVVVSDDTHGINITSSGIASDNPVLSDEAVRGNVVMSGAKYIESLPSSNVCIES